MILVTGGTGFIGRALTRQLVQAGHHVRTLVRPSAETPNLPRGVPVEVAVASLNDERGMRAALRGVDTVFHLASAEQGRTTDRIDDVDLRGTSTLVAAMNGARVRRVFYVSHLGADRASAYPAFKVKGIAEEIIRRSDVNFTILRSGLVYGVEDHFTNLFASAIRSTPFMLLPGGGETLIQPVWVEDLVTCLLWALDQPETIDRTYEIGGGEFFSFRDVLQTLMSVMERQRPMLGIPAAYLRSASLWGVLPYNSLWLDYLAANRTCAADSIPTTFGFLPAMFSQRLNYLHPTTPKKRK